MDGDFFALFCDLIDAVAHVGDIQFKIEIAGFGAPKGQAGSEVGGEVLRQPRTILDYGAAAIAHGAAGPETAPAIAIENLRCAGMRLVERGNNEFSWS